MGTWAPIFGGIIIALVGAIGAYVAAARRLSGKIDTSEASQLWEESRSIRNDYRDRLDAANQRQAKLEERMAGLERKNIELGERNVALLEEQLHLQKACNDLRDERDQLRREVADLRTQIGNRRENDRTS